MSFGPACERCGGNSYEGSDDNPVCPWCHKRKRRGSKEEMAEHIRLLRDALRPCVAILRHKNIAPPMNPGVQEKLCEQAEAAMKETQ